MSKINVAVMFGGRSVEHEISIITGLQVVENIDKSKYNAIPVYVDKKGDWYTGDELLDVKNYKDMPGLISKSQKVFMPPVPSMSKLYIYPMKTSLFKKEPESIDVDIVFPAFHGMHGEDGTIQGFFHLANIPYVGSGVTGSAVGMDKIIMKDVFKANDIPIVNYTWFLRSEYEENSEAIVDKVEEKLKYPMFVKPANLGSSIGISKAKNRESLIDAIDVAINYDRKIIVEEGVDNLIEINCSTIGNEQILTSVCEQPVSWEDFLSYDDKYLRQGNSKGMQSTVRRIPAPIPDEQTNEIQELSKKVFKVLDCAGISRIDFMIDKSTGKVFVNEINTMPGSVAFYLWEPVGIKFTELIDKLIQYGIEAYKERNKNIYTFDSQVLIKASSGKAGGAKGVK